MAQEEEQRITYPSRQKFAAYLTVYTRQTEHSHVEKYLTLTSRGSSTYTLSV